MPLNTPTWWQSRGPATWALWPLSLLYGAAAFLHGHWREYNAQKVNVPVISVGNITVGGTGKTPVVQWLTTHFAKTGKKVAVLSRGYGVALKSPMKVLPTHTAAQVGDEPLMLAQYFQQHNLPVTVYSGKDRLKSVMMAQADGADIIVLDDGFQYRTLKRGFDVVVLDGRQGLGNGFVLPAGPLREFKGALKRADFILATNASHPLADDHVNFVPQNTAALKGIPLVAFCGLGQPNKFFNTLKAQRLNVVETVTYPDHHAYTPADEEHLNQLARTHKAELITTAKDAVKLGTLKPHILHIEISGGEKLLNILNAAFLPDVADNGVNHQTNNPNHHTENKM